MEDFLLVQGKDEAWQVFYGKSYVASWYDETNSIRFEHGIRIFNEYTVRARQINATSGTSWNKSELKLLLVFQVRSERNMTSFVLTTEYSFNCGCTCIF
jgi:hypothetical protein